MVHVRDTTEKHVTRILQKVDTVNDGMIWFTFRTRPRKMSGRPSRRLAKCQSMAHVQNTSGKRMTKIFPQMDIVSDGMSWFMYWTRLGSAHQDLSADGHGK